MKVPLGFQITEYDCGTSALINAFSYLYDREEIPAELIKTIYAYTLDCYDKDGNLGQGGTSREAIRYLTHCITELSTRKKLSIVCNRLEKNDVNYRNILKSIKEKGVVFVRGWLQKAEHYILITNMDKENAYIFDSYYLDKNYYDNDCNVKIVLDKCFQYNRIVSLKRIFSNTKLDFSIGDVNFRECVLIKKKNAVRDEFYE